MKNKKNILVVLILILIVSIGYALLSSNLRINGLLGFSKSSFDVHFENIVVSDNSIETKLPVIGEDKNSVTFGGNFKAPGEFYEFNIDIVNSGTIDAMIDEIIIEGVNEEYKDYINFSVLYNNDVEVSKYNYLFADSTRTLKVRVEFEYDIDTLPVVGEFNISFSLNYIKLNEEFVNYNGLSWDFDYTGNEQVFNVLYDGNYKIELWGASGYGEIGGAYTSGSINLNKNEKFYLYVGPEGKKLASTEKTFNGGGIARREYEVGRGGGATDIRLISGEWDDFSSLNSRIMVASAGGGSSIDYSEIKGGAGGGLIGYAGVQRKEPFLLIQMYGSQIAGGGRIIDEIYWISGFGYGGAEYDNFEGTGGSGYFGGGLTDDSGGSGGSSYISGHAGCVSTLADSTITNIRFRNDSNEISCNSPSSLGFNSLGYNIDPVCSYHHSGYKFTNTVMIDGNGYSWTNKKGEYTGMPSPRENKTISGNLGNGYARITYLGK